eukprot:m.75997 g.75997  ORF g.75997 m.75997 type:complete len:598 (-) comp14417_c0_seq7:9-1802(-)
MERLACLLLLVTTSYADLSFKGKGYHAFDLELGYQENLVELEFTTSAEQGVLLFVGPDSGFQDYLLIAIKNGHVVANLNLGASVVSAASTLRYDDGFKHKLVLHRRQRSLVLQLDNQPAITQSTAGRHTPLFLGLDAGGLVLLGGMSADHRAHLALSDQALVAGFNGCIHAASLDSLDLLTTPASMETGSGSCLLELCSDLGSAPTCVAGSLVCGEGLLTCRCNEYASGPTCGIISASLAGNEQVHTVLTNTLSARSFRLSFYIKTADVTGQVLSINPGTTVEDFLHIHLDNGVLSSELHCGGGEILEAHSTTYISNNQWHFVELRMTSGQIQILVDGAVTGVARGSSIYTLFNIPPNRIVSMGGHLEATFAVLNISNHLFPLTEAYQSGDFGGQVQFEMLDAVSSATMMASQRQRASLNPNSQAGILRDHLHHVLFQGGDAQVEMVAKQPFNTRSTKIDLAFHTAQENTELLRLFGTADFVLVNLELGQLTVRFDLGGGERVLQLPSYISDDVDHHVVLELASHELHVSLDGLATTGSLKAPEKFKDLNVNAGPVLGAGFQGSIKRCVFNNVDVLSLIEEDSQLAVSTGVVVKQVD